MSTMIAASPPGQLAPAPSDPQNVPNDVSITPTANFKVFSGTRVSGRCTITPTLRTTTSAASADAIIRGKLSCAAPKVTTMNATSNPSRNTPLNDNVNAYQSNAPDATGCVVRV